MSPPSDSVPSAVRRPRLLIVQAGSAPAQLVRTHGDYPDCFIAVLGDPQRFSVAKIFEGETLPDLAAFDGVLVTGSPLSMREPAGWMEHAAGRLREAAQAGQAVLGVCFGHQMLAHAFGTPVVRNPRGREMGTVRVALSAEGLRSPLFEGLGPELRVMATHEDIVSAVPEGAVLLAGNENTAVQALCFGPRAWGVQFHPELPAALLRDLVRARAERIGGEGLDPKAIEASIEETPDGARILKAFERVAAG